MYGIAKYPVVDFRAEPKFRSERVHQIVFGEVVRLIEQPSEGEYVLAEDTRIAYKGYVKRTQLHILSDEEFGSFLTGKKVLKVLRAFCRSSGGISYFLPFGSRVYVDALGPVLPTGERFDLLDSPGDPVGDVVELALSFLGVPYLWGGTSSYGFDCSGFTNRLYDALGIDLPRDSHEQEAHTIAVDEPKPGDLLFMEGHVMLYAGDERVVHANGHDMCVQLTDLRESEYGARLKSQVRKIGRVL